MQDEKQNFRMLLFFSKSLREGSSLAFLLETFNVFFLGYKYFLKLAGKNV